MNESEYWTAFMRQRLSRRRLVQVGTAAGVGLWAGFALGCGGSQQQAKPDTAPDQPRSGGTMTWNAGTDPRGLDPHFETWPATTAFTTNTNNGLIKFTPDSSKIVPDLAESWEQPDEVTYIFKLTKGVKFHNVPPVNGRELVADDAKYSIERQMTNQPGKYQHAYFFLGKMASIDVPDKYTVKFVTNEPYAPFMTYMASPWTSVICREAVEKYGDLQTVAIGTGPFMLKSYTRNVEAVLVKNSDYFRKGKPYLDEIHFRYIPDDSTAVAAFLGEETDISAVVFTEVDRVKKAKPKAHFIDQVSMFPGVIRTSPYDDKHPHKPPFNDKRVRQAIQLAIDKNEFIKVVRSGWGIPMVGMIPPNLKPWALPDSEQIKQDLPKAKQLMTEAGYPNGFKTELICASPGNTDNAQVVKDQLSKIGIDVEVKPMESAQYYNLTYAYDYQMSFHSMLSGEEPEESLRPYFGQTATYFKWGNQDIWKKIDEQGRIVKDTAKRVQLIQDIQRMVAEDVPQIPVYIATYVVGTQARVGAFTPAWNQYDLRFEDVWVKD